MGVSELISLTVTWDMALVSYPQQKPSTRCHLALRLQSAPLETSLFNITGDAAMFVVTKPNGYVTTGTFL